MTKTAQRIATAFQRGERLRIKATFTDGHSIWYHGHRIAWRETGTCNIVANMCGWGTVTTRDRLNAIVRAVAPWTGSFSQQDHEQYFRGEPVSIYADITIVDNA